MKLNNRGRVGIIILIIVLAIGFLGCAGYIVYDKVIKKEEPKTEEKTTPAKTEEATEEKELTITSYEVEKELYNKCNDLAGASGNLKAHLKISLPQLDSTKTNAIALNKVIKADYKAEEELEKATGNRTILYNYLIKDNYLYILVEETMDSYCGSGGHTYKNYFYDIKNDKILTFEEGVKAAGYSLDDFQKLATAEITSYEQVESNDWACLKIENGELIPYYQNQGV